MSMPGNRNGRIELPECLIEPGAAAQNRFLADAQLGPRAGLRRNQRGRDVARADVFGQTARHECTDVVGKLHGVVRDASQADRKACARAAGVAARALRLSGAR
jgi:hypothetical protein